MRQATYFQAKGNNFFITKKHIAFIFLSWWLLINIYTLVLAPVTFHIYKSIVQFGDQPILGQNAINQSQVQNNKQHRQKKDKIKIIKNNEDQQSEDDGKKTVNRQQIKMTFKIKGKKSQMQKLKNQMTQQSLKIAMQTYYQSKNDIRNYQEEF